MGHLNTFLGINIGEQPLTNADGCFEGFFNCWNHSGSDHSDHGRSDTVYQCKTDATATDNDDRSGQSDGKIHEFYELYMPLFSVFMGFTLPAGLGLYWAISAIVRCVQQMAINKYLSKKSVRRDDRRAAQKSGEET